MEWEVLGKGGTGWDYPVCLAWASLVAQMVKNLPAMNVGDPGSVPGWGRSPGEGNNYPLQYSWGFPGGSGGKDSPHNAGDSGSTPG